MNALRQLLPLPVGDGLSETDRELIRRARLIEPDPARLLAMLGALMMADEQRDQLLPPS